MKTIIAAILDLSETSRMTQLICCIENVISIDEPLEKAAELSGTVLDSASAVALEMALQWKEQFGFSLTAIAAGPEEVIHPLRHCLALGVDKAIHIPCDTPDYRVRWEAIGQAVQQAQDAIILCAAIHGDLQRRDGPARLAQTCGCAYLPHAVQADLEGKRLTAICRVDQEELRLAADLPAVIAVHPSMTTPRLPRLSQILRAKKMEIATFEIAIPESLEIHAVFFLTKRNRRPILLNANDPTAVDEFVRQLKQAL